MPKPKRVFEFDAIGTHWWCESLHGNVSKQLQTDTVRYYTKFDRAYSRFIDTSYVARLNRHKILLNPPAELITMLHFAKELYEVSDGAFDITVGGTLHALGYGSRTYASHVSKDFWKHAYISSDRITIPDDAVLDFGGFGKGWLIDALVGLFRAADQSAFVINGGGDMFIQNTSPIEVALEDPLNPDKLIAKISVEGGFAASSQQKRQWQVENETKAHIIDPMHNNTAQSPIASVFVQAPTATIADAMATILFLRPELHEKLSKTYGLRVLAVKN